MYFLQNQIDRLVHHRLVVLIVSVLSVLTARPLVHVERGTSVPLRPVDQSVSLALNANCNSPVSTADVATLVKEHVDVAPDAK